MNAFKAKVQKVKVSKTFTKGRSLHTSGFTTTEGTKVRMVSNFFGRNHKYTSIGCNPSQVGQDTQKVKLSISSFNAIVYSELEPKTSS